MSDKKSRHAEITARLNAQYDLIRALTDRVYAAETKLALLEQITRDETTGLVNRLRTLENDDEDQAADQAAAIYCLSPLDALGNLCGMYEGHSGTHGHLVIPPWLTVGADPIEGRTFSLEPQPVTGRVVRANTDSGPAYYRRQSGGLWERVEPVEGRWFQVAAAPGMPSDCWWSELLTEHSQVELVPLTATEVEDERLYGPSHARWGDPYNWCPYVGCSLGIEHIGPHRNEQDQPLGLTEPSGEVWDNATEIEVARRTPCTCGRPDRHLPGCPRYARVSGGE